MKIVADNHADTLRHADLNDTPEGLLLATLGDELRALHGEAAADLPDALLDIAARIDGDRASPALAA